MQLIGEMIRIPLCKHTLLIDTSEDGGDKIYLDGVHLKTTLSTPYNARLIKPTNRTSIKRRITTIESGNTFYVLNIGHDGRIFLLQFTREAYFQLRGHPECIWSYQNDRHNRVRCFWDNDMTNPLWVKRY